MHHVKSSLPEKGETKARDSSKQMYGQAMSSAFCSGIPENNSKRTKCVSTRNSGLIAQSGLGNPDWSEALGNSAISREKNCTPARHETLLGIIP